MAKHFLFVVPIDPDVVNLLSGLREIFNEKKFKTPIHITLRGPCANPIEAPTLRDRSDEITSTPILISGPGQFNVDDVLYVYLKARSKYLETYTFKPDFPKSTHDANPHITIYEGIDKSKAKKVYDFLRQEISPFYCHKFEITTYLSQQLTLPFLQPKLMSDADISGLIRLKKIKKGIFERAALL